jgi:hypothetical protein
VQPENELILAPWLLKAAIEGYGYRYKSLGNEYSLPLTGLTAQWFPLSLALGLIAVMLAGFFTLLALQLASAVPMTKRAVAFVDPATGGGSMLDNGKP